MKHTKIEELNEFLNLVKISNKLENYAFQNIDFTLSANEFAITQFNSCIFLGCQFPFGQLNRLWQNNDVFPVMSFPFKQYPSELYSAEDLYRNYVVGNPESYKNTFDSIVYQDFIKYGKEIAPIKNALAQRLHDYAITNTLYEFLSKYEERKILAIMGGHGITRDSDDYSKVVFLSKKLTEKSYLMVSGGGPGSMEATHLGAWMAGRTENEVNNALAILSSAPVYNHKNWLDAAFEVMNKFPRNKSFESLGIPTWFYGHEPATPFASKIAKYFANSVREEGLLAIAKGGIIFTPGSAGTMQEIFQEANQNHYRVFGYSSPMIFYGESYWHSEIPVFPFLKDLIEKGKYQNLMISLLDNEIEIIAEIERFTGNLISG
jgi:predicted Rossmann-fold nucleotide-binding protein